MRTKANTKPDSKSDLTVLGPHECEEEEAARWSIPGCRRFAAVEAAVAESADGMLLPVYTGAIGAGGDERVQIACVRVGFLEPASEYSCVLLKLHTVMSAIRVAPATRAFANGNLVFGVVASGVADRDHVLLSSKSIGDFRLLSKDRQVTNQSHYGLCLLVTVFKGSGGSGALDSVYSVICSEHKSCRSGHFAHCFLQRAPGLVDTSCGGLFFHDALLQSDINSLHDLAALSDPISLSALDAVLHVCPACSAAPTKRC